ncbi:MAG TPA: hypothetical protein VHV10_02490 [Ktedonobacteraceae bacterium]|jgi:hypothetical protein|nr:hypothetical protein [Ktedonobacteraceae bacterium]
MTDQSNIQEQDAQKRAHATIHEPLEAKEVQHLTLDQLFELSLQELRKSLGVPKVVEADKIKQVIDSSKTEDTKEGN